MKKEDLEKQKKEYYKKISEIDKQIQQLEMEKLIETYGENFGCASCRFSAVFGLSLDGWHNCCGADNCTCCHSNCYKYKPDNTISRFIKENINKDKSLLNGTISKDKYNALCELGIDIFKITSQKETQTAIAILKLLFCEVVTE